MLKSLDSVMRGRIARYKLYTFGETNMGTSLDDVGELRDAIYLTSSYLMEYAEQASYLFITPTYCYVRSHDPCVQ